MRIPSSTYRLQFNRLFRFSDALKIAGYLHDLGVTDIYASPILEARQGSLHGYDIVDYGSLNPELGTSKDFKELASAVSERGMGWLQDVVSNHMAYNGSNSMLMDVLEKGVNSRYMDFFDIEWDHPYEGIKDKVLAPFLGSFYGEALDKGEIRLDYDETGITANYYGFRFPLKMESYATVLTHEFKRLKYRMGKDSPDYIKLLGVIYVLKNLPATAELDEIQYQAVFIKRMLWELYTSNAEVKTFIDENIATFNGRPGNPESFNLLDRLLGEQSFKFSFWKVAAEEINYRRFFNINELITLKVEKDQVFDHVHSLLFRIIKESGITGLRIDHIDGLYDPQTYLHKLKEKIGGMYVTVEKILGGDEEIPFSWEVEGSTGYDFLNKVNGIFCARRNEGKFTKIYTTFTGLKTPCHELAYEKKKLVTEMDMTSDVGNLAQLLKFILMKDRYGSDITLFGLKRAIVEVMSCFPVYRTYINQRSLSGTDIKYIKEAVGKAVRRNPALLNELKFLEKVLTLEFREYLTEAQKAEWLHFVMRFQQFTGPLMAKGFEDTLLYVYNRLISLNEVGGDPSRFGISADALHSFNKKRSMFRPHSMSATSTHDTKRGEDVRARINVLSEMPDEWEAQLKKWSALNRKKRKEINGVLVPDRNDEYFLYQTLIGSYPFSEDEHPEFVSRIKDYIRKAVREAKIHTAWLKPDTDYEETFVSFIDEILREGSPFLNEFLPFQKKISWYGVFNSLSQLLIKMTSPGVPDFYQGTELWDLSLVDPDNRRPVDFETRKTMLDEIKDRSGQGLGGLIKEALAAPADGRVKMLLTFMGLKARNRNNAVFENGEYLPLETSGSSKGNLFAFARKNGKAAALTIVPRFPAYLVKENELPIGESVWRDTEVELPDELKGREWMNEISGEVLKTEDKVSAAEAFKDFPGALFVSA